MIHEYRFIAFQSSLRLAGVVALMLMCLWSCRKAAKQQSGGSELEFIDSILARRNAVVSRTRNLIGLRDADEIEPSLLSDKYFRTLRYPPHNRPFEIIEISSVDNPLPVLKYRRIRFDPECSPAVRLKEMTEGCFQTLEEYVKEISIKELDSLFVLLHRTEFWNLSESPYDKDDVAIMDGHSIEMLAVIGRYDRVSQSIRKHSNLIQRQIPEKYIGITLINDYVDTLLDK